MKRSRPTPEAIERARADARQRRVEMGLPAEADAEAPKIENAKDAANTGPKFRGLAWSERHKSFMPIWTYVFPSLADIVSGRTKKTPAQPEGWRG